MALEARLSADITEAALAEAASALTSEPTTIVDLGSGTGAGAMALASRFPGAQVHGIDLSSELRGLLLQNAEEAGLGERIHAHAADLDGPWGEVVPGGADLVWAALSLHHAADPAAVLRQAFEVLRPGSVVVLTELSTPITLAPEDLGSGRAGLGRRVSELLAGSTPHTLPDWDAELRASGYTGVRHRELEWTVSTDNAEGTRFLLGDLEAAGHHAGESLGAEDQAALERVIGAVRSGGTEVTSTTGRAVWIGVRPQAEGPKSITADVAVVGGGAAGLAAAVALGRSRRRVVVIDAGQPRNAPADGAHNVLGHEGIDPLELLARGRAEAESYGAQILSGRATGVRGGPDDFTVEVDGGVRQVPARRIILATGLVDELLPVPGVEQAWGRTVLHCPFCHGWEVRDQRLAILTRDEVAVHQALLFRQLSDRVTLFLHEGREPSEEQLEQLAALDVPLVRGCIERLLVEGDRVRGVELSSGERFEADAAVIAPRFNARTELYEGLGGQAESTPFGRQIPADQRGMTEVPGVWAAGNSVDPMAMVVASAASGVMVGAAVHGDLAGADLNAAVLARTVR